MKIYEIWAEMRQEPVCYVEAEGEKELIEIMHERDRKREPFGMFPGWFPVEISKEKMFHILNTFYINDIKLVDEKDRESFMLYAIKQLQCGDEYAIIERLQKYKLYKQKYSVNLTEEDIDEIMENAEVVYRPCETEKYLKKVIEELKKVDKNFFENHYISLNKAVSRYTALKKIYDDDKGFDNYIGFKEEFFKFYGIVGLYTSEQFRENYYKKLLDLRNKKKSFSKFLIGEVENLTNTKELKDINKEGKEKIMFSFITKLLNIINDNEYPIYDSNIMTVFKFQRPKEMNEYIEQYEIIKNVYDKILTDVKIIDIIDKFKKNFPESEKLPNMRILDIIIWKLGEKPKK